MKQLSGFHLSDKLVLTIQTGSESQSVKLTIDDALGLCMSLAYQVRERLAPQEKFPCEFVRVERR
ncbi:hypothetical protein MASR1M60_15010 [Rhodocyclaceae bacterium]